MYIYIYIYYTARVDPQTKTRPGHRGHAGAWREDKRARTRKPIVTPSLYSDASGVSTRRQLPSDVT